MSAAHSPGPWRWERSADWDDDCQATLLAADGGEVAGPVTFDDCEYILVGQDDARLIAAAPEMLSLLKAYSGADEQEGASEELKAVRIAVAALIDRVEGEGEG